MYEIPLSLTVQAIYQMIQSSFPGWHEQQAEIFTAYQFFLPYKGPLMAELIHTDQNRPTTDILPDDIRWLRAIKTLPQLAEWTLKALGQSQNGQINWDAQGNAIVTAKKTALRQYQEKKEPDYEAVGLMVISLDNDLSQLLLIASLMTLGFLDQGEAYLRITQIEKNFLAQLMEVNKQKNKLIEQLPDNSKAV